MSVRFHMLREKDPTGISGIGRVAEGVIFEDGKVVIWFRTEGSLSTYDSIEQAVRVHGHNGMTRFVREDPVRFRDSDLWYQRWRHQNGNESRPLPSPWPSLIGAIPGVD